MEDISQYMQYAGLALTGIFVLCILGGMVFGLIRGWKRGLLRFALIIACMALALVLAPVIYESLLTTDMSFAGLDGSFSDVVAKYADGALDSGSVKDLPVIWQLLIGIPSMFANLILFVIIFGILRFITWILFGILKALFFGNDRRRSREYKKGYGPKVRKGRLGGMGIGALQGIAVALVFLVPFAAFANTAQTFSDNIDSELITEDSSYHEIMTYINDAYSIYTKSIPGSIYSSVGLDKLFYEPLTTVKVGDDKFSLESVGEFAAAGFNLLLKYDEASILLDADDSKENFKLVYADLLDYIDENIEPVFTNGMMRIILNGIGDGIKNGTIVLTTSSDEEKQTDFILLSVNEMLLSVSDNMADKLLEDVKGVVDTLKNLNNDGTLYALTNSFKDFDNLLKNETHCIQLGKALDDLLNTNLLRAAKVNLFKYLGDSMLSGVSTDLGFDIQSIQLHNVSWEGAMKTIYKAMELVSDMDDDETPFDNAVLGSRVTEIINTLQNQLVDGQDVTGIINAFESFVKKTIADLELNGIDEEFLRDKDLDILANSRQIGAMIDLMNDKDLFTSLSNSADNFGENASADIATLRAHLVNIGGATEGFKQVINGVICSIMDVEINSETDAVGAMIKALDAFDLILKAQEKLGDPSANPELVFTEENAEAFIDLALDGTVLDVLEAFVPEEGINLGQYKDMVKDKMTEMIDAAKNNPDITQEQKDELLDRFDRLAGILTINPEDIGLIPPLT